MTLGVITFGASGGVTEVTAVRARLTITISFHTQTPSDVTVSTSGARGLAERG